MLRMLALTAFAMVALPASAVTVHNRDAEPRNVTFDKGIEEIGHDLAPGASVTGSCPAGCAVRVAGRGHDFMAQEGDVLSIREMVLRRDGDSATAVD